jgi:hypothetical protein
MPAEHLTGHTHPEPPTASSSSYIVGAATGTIKHASAKSQYMGSWVHITYIAIKCIPDMIIFFVTEANALMVRATRAKGPTGLCNVPIRFCHEKHPAF